MNEIDHNQIIKLRRHLHAIAEVSGQEYNTSRYLQNYLKEHASGSLVQITSTGFVWVLDTGQPGPNVMFRAELDALPISEINEFTHRSTDEFVSHKCGHDGHMAILVGAILSLSNDLPECGKYYFLFQPAEETGEGAAAILASPKFDFTPDYIFALHNLPGYPLGTVLCRTGSLNAAVTSLIITFKGKTAHAAEPENGNNPAHSISKTIAFAENLQNPNTGVEDFSLITPVYMEMGEKAYGVSAGRGEVHFTLRAWTDQKMNSIKTKLLAEVDRLANQSGLAVSTERLESFAATNNDKDAVRLVKKAASEASLDYLAAEQPFKWGEDFGLFTEKFRGGFFGLGAGAGIPALHNPDYDFPDELIAPGVAMFRQLIKLTTEKVEEQDY
ncbi:MAG: amidohydrolase [Cyclobacteriaceae bacterium]